MGELVRLLDLLALVSNAKEMRGVSSSSEGQTSTFSV
jgi:hypothetical protein